MPPKGWHPSPEQRRKIGDASRRAWAHPERRAKGIAASSSRLHTPEEKEKIGRAHRGKRLSAETRQKIGAANRNPSPETREKMRQTAKKRCETVEWRAWRASQPRKPLSAEHRSKIQKAMSSPEVREKIRRGVAGRKPRTGWHHTAQARAKLSRSATGRKTWEGRHHTEESRERISRAKVNPSPETRAKLSRAAQNRSPETREAIRQANLRRPRRTAEQRERNRQARLRRHFPTKMTSIECALHDEFKRRRLRFEMHKTLLGRFQPDFTFMQARLIVQADGDYWHGRPDGRRRDAAFGEAALAAGWTVWRFGEKQIKQDPGTIGRAVAAFVRRHRKAVPPAPSPNP